jgi:hypothetical protein
MASGPGTGIIDQPGGIGINGFRSGLLASGAALFAKCVLTYGLNACVPHSTGMPGDWITLDRSGNPNTENPTASVWGGGEPTSWWTTPWPANPEGYATFEGNRWYFSITINLNALPEGVTVTQDVEPQYAGEHYTIEATPHELIELYNTFGEPRQRWYPRNVA